MPWPVQRTSSLQRYCPRHCCKSIESPSAVILDCNLWPISVVAWVLKSAPAFVGVPYWSFNLEGVTPAMADWIEVLPSVFFRFSIFSIFRFFFHFLSFLNFFGFSFFLIFHFCNFVFWIFSFLLVFFLFFFLFLFFVSFFLSSPLPPGPPGPPPSLPKNIAFSYKKS